VGGQDKAGVLQSIVDVLNLPEEVDRRFLYQVLMARESLGSTGIGEGIAIPHVRNPVVLHVSKPSIALCFLDHPIDFGAIDGQPVGTLFLLISPTVRTHLHMVSRLSFILQNPGFKATLKRQASREELIEALARAEGMLPALNAPLPGDSAGTH
jgi:PTS system nitrogen regulatory IIA component